MECCARVVSNYWLRSFDFLSLTRQAAPEFAHTFQSVISAPLPKSGTYVNTTLRLAPAGLYPFGIRTPLDIDFVGLHIDHTHKEFHVLVSQVFCDDAETFRWLHKCAEWREGG